MKHLKNRDLFLLENKNNTIEVFHGGDLNDNITSPLFVTENYYQAKTYGDKLYKFELNLNSKILDLTDIKTFRKIKSKIYDNYSKLYKKYFNIGFWSSEKAVEKDYNILKKYKNYDEIEKTYKERQRSDFWDKVEGLDRYGFNGYHDDAYWAMEFAKSDNATKEDKEFIKEFLILYRVYNNMTQLNHISLNEFGFFFLDYCKENGYDAYKAVSSDDSGKNRMIEYCIINLDILKLIGEFDINEIEIENESLDTYIKESNSNINDNFYKWFGDSKIVNEDGIPLVVYHGTKSEIESFNDRKKGSNTDDGIRGRGFYFSTNIKSAQSYGNNLYKVYLKINNPIDLLSFKSLDEIINLLEIDPSIIHERGRGTPYHSISIYPQFSGVFSGNVRENGFDGIIHGQEFVVFESTQIKSIHNDGSWDINDDNIYS